MTDAEIGKILKDMVVVCDTREQKNQHILKYFTDNNIPYIIDKLETADYSFILPNYTNLGLDFKFMVEKKNSLDEIAGNFSKDRERFQKEFERIGSNKMHLVIENATWKKLLAGSYRSQLTSKSFMASILTWSMRYSVPVWFCGVDESPVLIYNILYYELYNNLKKTRS